MSILGIILIVVLVLVIFGGGWGYSRGSYPGGYGYAPFGIVGLLVVILLILLLTGHI